MTPSSDLAERIEIAPDKLPADRPDIRDELDLAGEGRYVQPVCGWHRSGGPARSSGRR